MTVGGADAFDDASKRFKESVVAVVDTEVCDMPACEVEALDAVAQLVMPHIPILPSVTERKKWQKHWRVDCLMKSDGDR